MKRLSFAIIAAAYILAAAYAEAHGKDSVSLYMLAFLCTALSISPLAKD